MSSEESQTEDQQTSETVEWDGEGEPPEEVFEVPHRPERKRVTKTPDPTFTSDRIDAKWRGEEVTIWNRLTVRQEHELGHGLHESHHKVLAGDGSTGEKPDFITPEMDKKLHAVDVYPDVRILDPTDDEVTVL